MNLCMVLTADNARPKKARPHTMPIGDTGACLNVWFGFASLTASASPKSA